LYRAEMLAGGKHLAYNLAEHRSGRQALQALKLSIVKFKRQAKDGIFISHTPCWVYPSARR
jgi:hypothetical protein